jgi:choloylglycine hydrolase
MSEETFSKPVRECDLFRIKINQMICGALVTTAVGLGAWQKAEACTRILWNDNKLAVVAGRTMDWPESTEPILTVFPRGMERNGGRLGPAVIIKDNPAKWTSKYGSLVTTIYGVGTADGFNERGLAAHMLYLTATRESTPRFGRNMFWTMQRRWKKPSTCLSLSR